MRRLAIPIVVVGFLLAACAGSATLSNTNDKDVPLGAFQLKIGTYAGATSPMLGEQRSTAVAGQSSSHLGANTALRAPATKSALGTVGTRPVHGATLETADPLPGSSCAAVSGAPPLHKICPQ